MAKQITKQAISEAFKCSESPTGRHIWEIESPNGAKAKGICKWCGKEKMFSTILPNQLEHPNKWQKQSANTDLSEIW